MVKEVVQLIRENVSPGWLKFFVYAALAGGLLFIFGSVFAVIWVAVREQPQQPILSPVMFNPAAKPQLIPREVPPPSGSEIAASVNVIEHTCTREGSIYLLKVRLHVTSKFTRSGVLFHFRANDIESLPSLEAGPLVVANLLEKSPGHYALYSPRPWGIYLPTLRLKGKQTVRFTYRFEGETESAPKEIPCNG